MKKKWTLEMQKLILKVYFPKKGGDSSAKTMVHIHRLFEKFGFDEMFGRSAVMELLGYLNRKSESKYPAFSH